MVKKVRQIKASDIQLPGQGPSMSSMLSLIAGEEKEKPLPTMSNMLEPIRFVPTIFTSFNRAVVLGGAPVRTTWLVHGPTASGKTVFALGMVNSFVKAGHLAGYIDAEHAVSKQWFRQLGADMDNILFEQPDTFEGSVDLVDKWIANFKKGKKDGKIAKDTAFIIVIDVVHKLAPKRELAKLTGKADTKDNPLDKGWGRYRANLISVWIDKLTPVVGKQDIAFVMLAHERDNPDKNDSWFAPDYKVKGGKGLMFDAMVRVRINSGNPMFVPIPGGSGKKMEVGKTHPFTVAKNKVGYPNESGKFFTSNGKGLAPIGFDLPREIFTEAKYRGFIQAKGSYLYLSGDQKAQGEENAITLIRENPDLYDDLAQALAEELEETPYDENEK